MENHVLWISLWVDAYILLVKRNVKKITKSTCLKNFAPYNAPSLTRQTPQRTEESASYVSKDSGCEGCDEQRLTTQRESVECASLTPVVRSLTTYQAICVGTCVA